MTIFPNVNKLLKLYKKCNRSFKWLNTFGCLLFYDYDLRFHHNRSFLYLIVIPKCKASLGTHNNLTNSQIEDWHEISTCEEGI